MDFANRLELLLEVADCGSFAKAADRNHIDRSVLSKQIKRLEENLGVRLLNRSTRSLSLTSAGSEMVKQARKVREVLSDTRHLADTFHDEPKGHLKVSSTTLFGRMYLQKAIKQFMERYPQVTIEMMLDDHRVDMISEGFDIVFRIGPLRDSNMIARKLADNRLAIVASEDFVTRHGMPTTPEDLMSLPAVVYSNGTFIADKLRIASNRSGDEFTSFNMKANYLVNETELVLEAARDGLGYAQIGQFTLPDELSKLGLVQLLPEYQLPTHGEVYAMYSHRNQLPLAKYFIETVQEVIGTPPIWESYLSAEQPVKKAVA